MRAGEGDFLFSLYIKTTGDCSDASCGFAKQFLTLLLAGRHIDPIMDQLSGWRVAHKLEKRALLIAINCVAALSIFFFGYDQGMMGGVNNAKDYIDLMGFGHVDEDGEPVVTDSLLQGGIVSRDIQYFAKS